MRLEITDRQLSFLVLLTVVSLTAGTPLQLAAAGRNLPLGPADALVGLLVVTLPLWYRRLPPLTLFLACSALFVLWVCWSSVFLSIDFRRSVLNSKSLVQAAVLYLAAWQVARSGRGGVFHWAIRLFNLVLALQIAWAMWGILQGPSQGYYILKGGVTAPLGDNNFLAVFLEFGLMYELLSRRRGWLPFALLDAAAIFMTFSRGALVATGLLLVVLSVALLLIRGQRRASLLVSTLLVVSAAVLLLSPLFQIVASAFTILGHTASSRFELWQDAWQAAAWRPVTGVGYGAYGSIGTLRDAHSLPLALLAETGIIGLALFTLALLAVCGRATMAAFDRRNGQRRAEALGVAAGLAVVVLHSLIEPFFLRYSLLWAAAICAWVMGPWRPDAPAGASGPSGLPT